MDSFPDFPSPGNPTNPPPPHAHPPLPPPPPHVVPPPPFHPITPPAPPPPYTPDNGPTVIVIVFISFGCILFLALCMFALWCVIKRRQAVEETDIVRTDKHVKVKEEIVQGRCGPEAIVLSVEEDKHTEEEIFRKDKVGGKHLRKNPDLKTGQSSSETAPST